MENMNNQVELVSGTVGDFMAALGAPYKYVKDEACIFNLPQSGIDGKHHRVIVETDLSEVAPKNGVRVWKVSTSGRLDMAVEFVNDQIDSLGLAQPEVLEVEETKITQAQLTLFAKCIKAICKITGINPPTAEQPANLGLNLALNVAQLEKMNASKPDGSTPISDMIDGQIEMVKSLGLEPNKILMSKDRVKKLTAEVFAKNNVTIPSDNFYQISHRGLEIQTVNDDRELNLNTSNYGWSLPIQVTAKPKRDI